MSNKLTHAEVMKISRWLEQHKNDQEFHECGYEKIRQELLKKGISPTPASLKHLCTEYFDDQAVNPYEEPHIDPSQGALNFNGDIQAYNDKLTRMLTVLEKVKFDILTISDKVDKIYGDFYEDEE